MVLITRKRTPLRSRKFHSYEPIVLLYFFSMWVAHWPYNDRSLCDSVGYVLLLCCPSWSGWLAFLLWCGSPIGCLSMCSRPGTKMTSLGRELRQWQLGILPRRPPLFAFVALCLLLLLLLIWLTARDHSHPRTWSI